MSKGKAIVTGGAGFIGAHLCRALAADGYGVHTIDTLTSKKAAQRAVQLMDEGVDVVRVVDVCDRGRLADVFEGARFVFHTAALPRVQYSLEHPDVTHDVNVTGTLNVLLAARDAGVERVIFSSSSSVYGDQKLPLREDMVPHPQSPYGMHKYMGELYCRMMAEAYGFETVSLRYFNVYGPGLDPDGAYALVIGKFLKQRENGEPMTITGDGEQTRDFTHVSDVVRANLSAVHSENVGAGEVINIGAGSAVSVNRIAEIISGPTTYIAPRLEPRHTLAANEKALVLLGWKPSVSLEEGITALVREGY